MNLKDTDIIISRLEELKFTSETDESCKAFNLGIMRAIDVISNAPTVDAKLKIDKKDYQKDYYQKVTKLKRAKAREERQNGLR